MSLVLTCSVLASYPEEGKGTSGNYFFHMHVIKQQLLCNTTNLMGWVSVVTQTYSSLTACMVPLMAGTSTVCHLFRDVVAVNRA